MLTYIRNPETNSPKKSKVDIFLNLFMAQTGKKKKKKKKSIVEKGEQNCKLIKVEFN
jgi:hypothetical protein